MALVDFQTALGRLVRTPYDRDPLRSLYLLEDERSCLEALKESRGLDFTVRVQHSWCIGRAKKTAGLTLSMLPAELRERLLDAWTGSGGGTSSFFLAEAEGFLEFVASQLIDPSHELTICRLEQATLRANEGAAEFTARRCVAAEPMSSMLRRGRYAAVVPFYGEPDEIMSAISNERPLPPVSPEVKAAMLFAPGLEQLCRVASLSETALWRRLAAPAELMQLRREGHCREDIQSMLRAGSIECDA